MCDVMYLGYTHTILFGILHMINVLCCSLNLIILIYIQLSRKRWMEQKDICWVEGRTHDMNKAIGMRCGDWEFTNEVINYWRRCNKTNGQMEHISMRCIDLEA